MSELNMGGLPCCVLVSLFTVWFVVRSSCSDECAVEFGGEGGGLYNWNRARGSW